MRKPGPEFGLAFRTCVGAKLHEQRMTKTAVTVLQEMMVKMGLTPEYNCVSQTGPQHLATFEYRCQVLGVTVTATAHSKKDAKQEVARLMLLQLSKRGYHVPAPYNRESSQNKESKEAEFTAPVIGPHSYVVLLKDLCEEYHLPGVEYTLVSDTGPPHCRQFTMKVRIGQHERLATSTTKKNARQMAAEQLYKYMRENLHRVTKDFTEVCNLEYSPLSIHRTALIFKKNARQMAAEQLYKYMRENLHRVTKDFTEVCNLEYSPLSIHRTALIFKKNARQMAAEQLYKYMRENLHRVTKDFTEMAAEQLYKYMRENLHRVTKDFTEVCNLEYSPLSIHRTALIFKKNARQMAAEQLYKYMRENLHRVTKDFTEMAAEQLYKYMRENLHRVTKDFTEVCNLEYSPLSIHRTALIFKKNARQMAAEQLYKYMRENLHRVTKDFTEMAAEQLYKYMRENLHRVTKDFTEVLAHCTVPYQPTVQPHINPQYSPLSTHNTAPYQLTIQPLINP
ncbi:double-stranded RNA binding motif domain-containing protein [Phthorimaea operculella]|nr:double-stranded RNA binding motif domain-containing protein [Phthorimaea operculella]